VALGAVVALLIFTLVSGASVYGVGRAVGSVIVAFLIAVSSKPHGRFQEALGRRAVGVRPPTSRPARGTS